MSHRTSPDSAVFKVTVVGSHNNQIQNDGTLEATPTSLIYTDNQGSRFTWELVHVKKYGSNGEKLFTIETGRECPTGVGVYIFSTSHAPYLESIVSRHLTSKARLSSSPDSDVFSPTKNGMLTTPTNGRTMLRSSSLWSLPSNQFAVRSITEDPQVTKEGLLEITSQEIVFLEGQTGHQYHWPIALLRRYGYEGNKFTFDASGRCPGGGGVFGFITPKASEIQALVRRQSKCFSGSQLNLASPPQRGGRVTSPPKGISGREKRGSLRRARSAMDVNRHLFEVVNISDDLKEVGKGTLEVTTSDLIYIDHMTEEKWRWPLRYLRRYGCDGEVFSFEAGRRCPGGEGLYAFSCPRAPQIHEAIVMSIRGPQQSTEHAQMFVSTLSLADPSSQQRAGAGTRRASKQIPIPRGRGNGLHLTPPPLSRKQIPLPRIPPSLPSAPPPRDIPSRGSVSSPSLDENDSSSVSSGVVTPPPSGTSSPPPKPSREHRKKKKGKGQEVKELSEVRLSWSGEPLPPSPTRPPPVREKPVPPPKPHPQVDHQPSSSKDQKNSLNPDKNKSPSKRSSLLKLFTKRKSADISPAPPDPAHLEGVVSAGLYDVIPEGSEKPSMYANVSMQSPHTQTTPTHHSVYANITRQGSVGRGEVSVSTVPMPHRGNTPPPQTHTSTPDHTPSTYQNVDLKSGKSEANMYANVPVKAPKTPPRTKYTEIEIIDGVLQGERDNRSHDTNDRSHSISGKSHDVSPDPPSPASSSTNPVQYQLVDFMATRAIEKIQQRRGTNEEFAEMLDRHTLRQDEAKTLTSKGSRSKK